MSDLLAAASLLLTVVTILYSLWYPEITAAIGRKADIHAANRTSAYKESRAVLIWKTIPLSVVATLLCAINIPDAFDIICYSLAQLHTEAHARYDAVKTIFVVVTILLLFLAIHTIVAAIKLGLNVRKLNPARGDYV